MKSPPPVSPERLARGDDRAARVLRAADPAFRAPIDEAQAFEALDARRRRVRLALPLLVLPAAAVVLVAWGVSRRFEPAPFEDVQPERASLAHETTAAQSSEAVLVPSAPSAAGEVSRPSGALDASSVTEASCRKLLTKRRFEETSRCFETLAKTSSSVSEQQVALLEAARLQLRELNAPQRALALLDNHRERYPEGPLRGEVAELRVYALSAVGRDDEALAVSETMLAQPWGRPLASALHLWRGRVFEERLNDCGRASAEYVALVGEAGARGEEAEFRRASCLERLGRSDEAVRSYRAYLGRVGAARSALARERLERLAGDQSGK